METELNFRFAVREDTPLILQMIRELVIMRNSWTR